MKTEVVLQGESRATLYRDFLSPVEAEAAFDVVAAAMPWSQEWINYFGPKRLPRLTAWAGDVGYSYSGVSHAPTPWPPAIAALAERVAEVAPRPNGVLGNLYRGGADKVTWHSDDEPIFGNNPTISSLSLGSTRRFNLRCKADRQRKVTVDLPPGSLLVMEGATQDLWQHCVPPTKRAVGPRINLTFRVIKDV